MTTILANFPWWLTAAFILGGFIMLTHGNRRGNSNIRSIGLTIVSLAFLLGAARFLIDTPAEKCEKRTRLIVDSVNRGDYATLANLLDTDTAVDLSGADKTLALQSAKGALIPKAAEATAKKVGLTEVAVWELTTKQIPDQITITFIAAYKVKETGDAGHPSGWEFDYLPPAKPGDRWDLRKIKLISLEGQALSG